MAVAAEPEQFRTGSSVGERRFATVNPATGEVVREYPFLPSDQIAEIKPTAELVGHNPQYRKGADYVTSLDSLPLHVLQHACFFASALAFWWAVFGGAARAPRPVSLACLFTTMLHTSALGAVLTFAPTAWYMHGAAHVLGLSSLEDQQLGGLVMWIPGGVAYVVGALAVARTWLARPRALAIEQVHHASGASRDESDWSGHRATRVGPPRGRVRAQRAC